MTTWIYLHDEDSVDVNLMSLPFFFPFIKRLKSSTFGDKNGPNRCEVTDFVGHPIVLQSDKSQSKLVLGLSFLADTLGCPPSQDATVVTTRTIIYIFRIGDPNQKNRLICHEPASWENLDKPTDTSPSRKPNCGQRGSFLNLHTVTPYGPRLCTLEGSCAQLSCVRCQMCSKLPSKEFIRPYSKFLEKCTYAMFFQKIVLLLASCDLPTCVHQKIPGLSGMLRNVTCQFWVQCGIWMSQGWAMKKQPMRKFYHSRKIKMIKQLGFF